MERFKTTKLYQFDEIDALKARVAELEAEVKKDAERMK